MVAVALQFYFIVHLSHRRDRWVVVLVYSVVVCNWSSFSLHHSKTQGLNDHAQVSQPQDQDGLTEEVSKIQDSTEQPEDSTPQDLSGQVQEIKAQDLKDWVKEQLAIETTIETLEQQQPVDMEVYSSRRSSISHPQKMTMTTRDDVPSSPLPELSLDE